MPTSQPRPDDDRYVPAASDRADEQVRILKHDDTFSVVDRFGDIEPDGPAAAGIYDHDTRFLSRLSLRVGGARPALLSSGVRRDNRAVTVDLMTPQLHDADGGPVPRGSLHLRRTKLLRTRTAFERLRLRSYASRAITLPLTIDLDADFADLFEVRGMVRERRGRQLPPSADTDGLRFGYEGLDGLTRETLVTFDPPPDQLEGGRATWEFRLDPAAAVEVELTVRCSSGTPSAARDRTRFADADELVTAEIGTAREEGPEIVTGDRDFDAWLERSLADLRLLRTATPHGPYPYAGLPWFSAPFGRDGILTALEALWVDPGLARGVLDFLAATQATSDDPDTEAEPGKILHEARFGEMARTGELPFARYYGSADATPLFVMLAGASLRASGDREAAAAIWPHVQAALTWMDRYGDADGDGFLEYGRRSSRGVPHQGWRDAHDAVFRQDGSLAEVPIALSELQGYWYAAQRSAAELARALERDAEADALDEAAAALRDRFEAAFWCEELGTYALALDGDKRPCRVRGSSAGHCLWTGIAGEERASRAARTLMDASSFSGWGIRTIAAGEARYSPIAYHNGSIWPHDSAIVAAGLARYGLRNEAATILSGIFAAARTFEDYRLPELFCGFDRTVDEPPIRYPVACSPQAWAAAAPFLLLGACLGLEVIGAERRVIVRRPHLPDDLDEVRIRRLPVGHARVDLAFSRRTDGITVESPGGDGEVTVVLED